MAHAVGDLEFADILDDRRNLRVGHLTLRRHVAVRPMVLPHTRLDGEEEGSIGMMARIVDVVHQRRPAFGTGGMASMARAAIRVVGGLAFDSEG